MPRFLRRFWVFVLAALIVPFTLVTTVSHSGSREPVGSVSSDPAILPAETALAPATCNGSRLVLTPGTPPTNNNSTNVDYQRGEFITALRDFHICSMGINLGLASSPQTLHAYIYAANNATRGALLASASVTISGSGSQVYFVPIDFTLQACQEYELIFLVPANDNYERWDVKNVTKLPFNIQGAIVLRWPSCGCAVTFDFPHIELVGTPGPAPHTSDFAGPNAVAPSTDAHQTRGIYVNMRETSRLASFGFEADLVAGQVLTAVVYNATGTTRGSVVATGTYVVPSAGLEWHDVPVNALLVEGNHYDLSIQFGATNVWYWWDERTFTEPFNRDVFDVIDAELGGGASNFALPHFRATWDEHTAGSGFDLSKPNDPPLTTNQTFGGYGAYITSLANQSLFAVSWRGDIPAGESITATLYFAVGNTRDGVATTGTIVSGGSGMRWHEIPLSFPLGAGGDYDINISFNNATQWNYWDDRFGLPYSSYGVIQVRDAEKDGNASNFALIHMRVHACNPTLTAIADRPARTPMFLAAPAPNPSADGARVDFSLEEGGPVALHVYDVAGRLVNTVLEGSRGKGWNSATIDSRHLASGVYFLKLQTAQASVTRKFVVIR